MTENRPAPHQLDLVMDFVNTSDLDTGEEALGSPAQLSAWLSERRLLPKGRRLGPKDLERALELREALRRTMLANNGGPEAKLGKEIPARTRERLFFRPHHGK